MTSPTLARGHFDSELDSLQDLLLEMAGRAEELVRVAMEELARRDALGAKEIRATEDRIDQLEVEIDERVVELLALQQPMATDLRFVFVVVKACRDIERIGDHAVNIAGAGHRAAAHPPLPEIREIWEMGDRARGMLSRALGALVNRDADTARAVIAEDEVVDTLRRSAFDLIVSYMQQQERYISPGVSMILVVQNLERIGDLATNIAEEIVYLVEGHSIKHSGAERPS